MTKEERQEFKKNLSNKFTSTESFFQLLGDSTRIKIIALLLKAPNCQMKVEDITKEIYLSRPAVSHHLIALKDAGILKLHEESRYNYYQLVPNDIWNELCDLFHDISNLTKEYD